MLNLKEYNDKPTGLVHYIPWACLIAPGILLNKDGSLQRTLRYRGPDLESSTPEQLVAYTARLNNLLRRLGSGWLMSFEASRRHATGYPASEFEDDASWIVDEERRGTFEEAGTHFETDFYLTLTWLPSADSTSRLENLIIDDPADVPQYYWLENLGHFQRTSSRLLDLIETIMPEAGWLTDDETLTYLHHCVSTKRHPVRCPDIPACLDYFLTDCDLKGGLSPELGDHHLRVVSVLGFPSMTEPGLLNEIDQLGFSYRWVTRFMPLDKADAEKILTKYRRQWFAKRKTILTILKETLENEPAPLVNTDADNKAADVDAALQELGQDLVSYGYLTIAITVSDPDKDQADEKARAIERVLNGRGFNSINESVNAVDAWLGTHPGNAYANVRQPLINSLNLAHMAPVSALWAGPESNEHLDAPPLLLARSGSGTPFRLVTHQGDVGHTMIVGPTGAGKSVLLSLMAMQFRRYQNSRVFAFDKGRSARAAMLAMGASEYELNVDGAYSFQPLAQIDDDAEIAFAQTWVLALLEQEGVTIDPTVSETIWTALSSLAEAPTEQRTLTGLVALIQSADLRQALTPYTLNGPFGAILDADKDCLGDDDLALFEMESIMQDARLAAPVLSYIFHRLKSRFDGSPTLFLLDEAWVFLDHPMFASRLREWLKTLRKLNVSVVVATQSLSDIEKSSIAPALIESCPTRIFLPNNRAEEPAMSKTYEAFGLNTRQIELIARATQKQDYYLQCPSGNRMFDLELGPVGLAFCAASSKADQADIDDILASAGQGMFAAAWLSRQGLEWAADLLHQSQEGGLPCAAE
ncbi:MAG: conjugal transfer protein TrbE [Pseudomonadota bacterium]